MLALEPIKRKHRVPEEITAYLKGLIIRGELKVGDRLPAEQKLAETLMVSRNSVREALRSLELTGLTESRQGDGTFIRQADLDTLREPLSSLLITQVGVIADILDARKMIEPPMAQRAALNATPEQISSLGRVLEQQERAVMAGQSGIAEDSAFHHILAEATGNNVLVKLVEAMLEILYASRERYLLSHARAHASLKGHDKVLQAIVERDPEGAYRAMMEHLREVEHVIGKAPSEAHELPNNPVREVFRDQTGRD